MGHPYFFFSSCASSGVPGSRVRIGGGHGQLTDHAEGELADAEDEDREVDKADPHAPYAQRAVLKRAHRPGLHGTRHVTAEREQRGAIKCNRPLHGTKWTAAAVLCV
eukprot:1892798-Rhodomonas_salina.2